MRGKFTSTRDEESRDMSTRAEATIEDLYRLTGEGKAELVNGEVVFMSPSGAHHGMAVARIVASLLAHERSTRAGHVIPDNVGFVVDLPHRKSFSPDVAYHFGPVSVKFVSGAPAFAVEVRSEGDYGPAAELELAAKRSDYFAAGTTVVWDVDLEGTETIRSYRVEQPDQPLVFRRGEHAHAEPAVTGWSMPVDELWT
jgi:Uma2 family endonuclease